MDIVRADALLKEAGYTGTYTSVTLRWPLYPSDHQPYYIFRTTNSGYVFVGVTDEKVRT